MKDLQKTNQFSQLAIMKANSLKYLRSCFFNLVNVNKPRDPKNVFNALKF